MEFNEFLKLINRKKQTMLVIVFVAIMVTIGLSLLSPLKYGAKSRLLVLQNSTGSDAYSLSKSNEYLGNLFAQVAYSGSFYDQIRTSQYNIDTNYFSGNYAQQLKKWQQTVKTSTQGDTGIIEVNVYHTDVQQAKQISLAINDILINKNQDYHGGQNIKVSIIDQPLVSNYPVKPNLPYNVALALAASFVISLFYIYIFPESKEKKRKVARPKEETYIPVREVVEEAQREYTAIQGNISNVLRK